MATLDQLPADQRAILELVIQRGRSYESLSEVLQIPPTRVRELARTALSHLAPVSAERVDPEWRGQIADYVLGQQAGPESTATRGHLKRSEAARAWTASLIDSLDSLYGTSDRPMIPDGDGGRVRERDRRAAEAAEAERERERERREREEWERERAEREREQREREEWERERAERERERAEREERDREWERERARRERERASRVEPERERASRLEPEREGAVGVLSRESEPATAVEPERDEAVAALSPEARRALRRRRLLGALVAIVAVLGVAAIVLIPITHTFSNSSTSHRRTTSTSASNRIQIVGELPLRPAGTDKTATGLAVIAKRGSQEQLVVQAKVPPSKSGYAYEVWLYNSQNDVASLGAQVTDAQGNYQGAGPLPANFTRFKDIVISYERIGTGTTLSGPIVLRGAFSDLQAPPQNQSGSGQTAPGTTPGQTAPSPTPGQTAPSPTPGQGTTP